VKLPLLLACLALALVVYAFKGADPPSEQIPPPAATEATESEPIPEPDPAPAVLYLGHGAEWWHWQTVLAERKLARLERKVQQLRAQVAQRLAPTAQEEYAIHLAAIAYGQSEAEMRRVADCESHFFSGAYNSSSGASGSAQFLPSTFRSTPYGHLNIFEPLANSLAMGWMWSVGRKNEWSCK